MALNEHPELVESFEKLGLSPNEAKVYLALLENHPITGYQLSKISGILRPVVYEMLNRLVEKGGARIVKSNPDTYVPVEIKEFLSNIESNFTEAKQNIAGTLKKFMVIDDSDFFWNILGKKNILNSIIEMTDRAENSILASFCEEENFRPVASALETRAKEGIDINLFSHYAINTGGLTIYSYNLDKTFVNESIPRNMIYFVTDNTESIIANISDDKSAKAVYSKNQATISIVNRYILHNIYLIRLWKLHGTDKLKLVMNNQDKKLIEIIDKYLSGNLF